MWYGLTLLDWAVVLIVLVGIAALGFGSRRRARSLDEYFAAGRNAGVASLTLMVVGSSTSGEQAANVASTAVLAGSAAIWYQLIRLPGIPFYWFIAPLFRRMRAWTPADFIEARFGQGLATLYAVYGILMSVLALAGGLFAVSDMIEMITGGAVARKALISAAVLIFVSYTAFGGLRSVIRTNWIQAPLVLAPAFLLLAFLWERVDGLEGLHAFYASMSRGAPSAMDLSRTQAAAVALGKPEVRPFYAVMLAIMGLAGIIVSPSFMMTAGAGRTERTSAIALTAGQLFKRILSIGWVLTGLACAAIYVLPDSADLTARKEFARGLFAHACHDVLPPGAMGLMLAALVAAIMSVCDIEMMVGATLFTTHIYRKLGVRLRFAGMGGGRNLTEELAVARSAGILLVAASGVIALAIPRLMPLIEVIVIAPAAIGVSLWLALVWRGHTAAGVIAGGAGGWGAWIFLEWQRGAGLVQSLFPSIVTVIKGKLEVDDAWIMLAQLIISVVLGVGVSLITQQAPRERLDAFFRLLRTPVRPGECIDRPGALPADYGAVDVTAGGPNCGWLGFAGAWLISGAIVMLTVWIMR